MKLRRRLTEGGILPLTPLIDVMFQVLLYYMLTSSVSVQPALRVDLPRAYTTAAEAPTEIVVTIAASGAITVGDRTVQDSDLVEALRRAAAENGTRSAMVLGDASIPYQSLITVVDRIRLAGLEAVSLGAVKLPTPPE